MSEPIPCPFKVGDRIHEVRAAGVSFGLNLDRHQEPPRLEWEPDPSKPDAIVTSLTGRGFTYEYVGGPIPIGRAAWGTTTTGGECFEAGYPYWVKV